MLILSGWFTGKILAQSSSTGVSYLIEQGDTIPVITLDDCVVTASDDEYRKKFNKYRYYVLYTLPYARMAKELTLRYDDDLSDFGRKREKKKYLRHETEELKDRFSSAVKKMSVNQGKVLCKLIYRETGMTAYEIIDKYLGGTKAFMWQMVSKTGGADLKLTFDPKEGDDKVIEDVMKQVEAGKLKPHAIPEKKVDPKNKKGRKLAAK